MKLFLLLITILVTPGCTTPVRYTIQSLQSYDKDTEYRIDESEDGFTVTVYYSRYQFIPESGAVVTACKSALTSLAHEHAEAKGKTILPVNDQRIKLSMGRNGFTGITSCSATVKTLYR
jgi:hypothetical protein